MSTCESVTSVNNYIINFIKNKLGTINIFIPIVILYIISLSLLYVKSSIFFVVTCLLISLFFILQLMYKIKNISSLESPIYVIFLLTTISFVITLINSSITSNVGVPNIVLFIILLIICFVVFFSTFFCFESLNFNSLTISVLLIVICIIIISSAFNN